MPRYIVRAFARWKAEHQRIAMLTAYDAFSARLAVQAGVDVLLVGDSVGMVVQGHDTTLPVTLGQMTYHCAIVTRAAPDAFVVGDLPFQTYHTSPAQALRSAARLMQRSGVSAVKLEGGAALAPTVAKLVSAGIPVMGHIGVLPQSVHGAGGYRVQGRSDDEAARLLADARALEAAGAFALVLELVSAPVAAHITAQLGICTIGIGAGAGCDGQVQVFHDVLGLSGGKPPRHAKVFADAGDVIREGLSDFVRAVREGVFPASQHSDGAPADPPTTHGSADNDDTRP